MKPGLAARALRAACLAPHFRGKSRLESLVEPFVRLPRSVDFPQGFVMDLDRSRHERAFYFRDCEPDTARLISEILKPGMRFLDCGAHIGFYSLLASKLVGDGGAVYSFEPTALSSRRLAEHLAQNGCGNVRAFQAALGERTGSAPLYRLADGDAGMNSLARGAGPAQLIETCEVLALDGLLEAGEIKQPDLVKIDVEGGEYALLRGAQKLLRGDPAPAVIVELSAATLGRFGCTPEDVVRYLLSLRDYRIEWRHGGRAYEVSADRRLPHYAALGRDHGSNYFFLPRLRR